MARDRQPAPSGEPARGPQFVDVERAESLGQLRGPVARDLRHLGRLRHPPHGRRLCRVRGEHATRWECCRFRLRRWAYPFADTTKEDGRR
jgi:hypothetical protein